MEFELACHAAIFRSGLENWIYNNVPKWIRFVDGDLKKVGDFINCMRDDLDELLNVFASTREWELIIDDDGIKCESDENETAVSDVGGSEAMDITLVERDEENLDDVE